MASLQSHLTVLQAAASRYPDRPVFRLAQKSPSSDVVDAWVPVSYQKFLKDVELSARYWYKKLSSDGLASGSVVGLWYLPSLYAAHLVTDFCPSRLGGLEYLDVINIYGVSRAGFVPQLFSLRLPNPTVVFELLQQAKAKALIFDPSFESAVRGAQVPAHRAAAIRSLEHVAREYLPPFNSPKSKDDHIFIFHTSGSTSGSPKLVPCNAGWVDSLVYKAYEVSAPVNPAKQDVSTWM